LLTEDEIGNTFACIPFAIRNEIGPGRKTAFAAEKRKRNNVRLKMYGNTEERKMVTAAIVCPWIRSS
jgi:hypothetical protein